MPHIKLKSWKPIVVAILLVMALLSATVISKHASSPGFYHETLATINEQKQVAVTLSSVVTVASTALSILPEDYAAAIASELADLSTPLFLIVCVLYMQQYLLTTLGWAAFTFLLPGACISLALYTLWHKEVFFAWAKKLLILALALVLVIPAGAKLTEMIKATFSEQVEQTFDAAFRLSEETGTGKEEQTNAFLSFLSNLSDNVAHLLETARNMLSTLVDAVAILLITSCIVPILTVLVFVWIVKSVLQINVSVKNFSMHFMPTRRHRILPFIANGDSAEDEDDDEP